jgi:FecR protein
MNISLSGFRFRKSLLSCLLLGALAASGGAQESVRRVGNVVDIDGPRLYTNRLKTQGWYQAYCGMTTYLTERLRTDAETQAVLEFLVGGRAGIGRNSHVEIMTPKEVGKAGATMRINAGTFWANLDRQEKKFEIQTAGGVIGIEGTELLVGVDEETGVTEVLLFEGKVTVVDKDGKEKVMFPGDYAEFGGAKGMCVLSYPSSSLRTLVVERFPKFSSFLATQKVTSIPTPASPTLVRGYNKTRADLLTVLGQAQGATGSAASGLNPAQTTVAAGAPSFRWDAVSGAASYAFYISQDEELQDIVFSSRVDSAGFSMPDGAQGLESGRYFWSVIPLNESGNALAQASQSWFETPGWSTPGVSLDDQ